MEGDIKTESIEKSFEVESILDYRSNHGKKEYLVKWKSHSDLETSWETENNITCFGIINGLENIKNKSFEKNISSCDDFMSEYCEPLIVKLEPLDEFSDDITISKDADSISKSVSADPTCVICGITVLESRGYSAYDDNDEIKVKCQLCCEELITSEIFPIAQVSNLNYVNQIILNSSSAMSQRAKSNTRCSYCQKKFSTAKSLREHVRIHTGERPYSCKICGQSFIQQSQMKRHELTHSDVRKFKCDSCDGAFKRIDQLRIHQITHSEQRKYSCELCNLTFKHKSSLTYHLFVHTNQRDYKCETCGQTFKCITDMKKHQVAHGQDRVHACTTCGKSFKCRRTLNSHERSHVGVRKYKCQQCKKSFLTSSSLKTHQRIHTGERPYQCSVCLKSFVQCSSLIKHKLIHTGERVSCDLCEQTFSHSSSLRRHKRRLHFCAKLTNKV